jgi:2-hydroxychromene-2-carboxylate isomerase
VLKPYDFQLVVPQTGGIPLKTRPEPRKTYHALELARWSDYLGLPLNWCLPTIPRVWPTT